jgi:hypothetical protein
MKTERRIRFLSGRRALALAVVLLLSLTSMPPVDADVLRCRSDPAVLLSDGTILDLSADIGTLLWNIERVDYVLRVPRGLRPVLVLTTPSWPTTIETFTIRADRPPGVYDSSTVVRTKTKDVDVTANLLVGLRYGNAHGREDQVLRVTVEQGSLLGLI